MPTAFEGKNTIGIRYPDKVTCLECSTTIDMSDEPYLIEDKLDTSHVCALCSKQI